MRSSRFLMAALTVGLLSSAALAAAPTADQVSVPEGVHTGGGKHDAKLKALSHSPEELAMFRTQLREETRNLPRDQRKAYRKKEFQRIRAMNDAQKASWLKDLDAKWAALSPDRKQRIEQRTQRHEQRHEERRLQRHKGQDKYQSQDTGQPQQ